MFTLLMSVMTAAMATGQSIADGVLISRDIGAWSCKGSAAASVRFVRSSTEDTWYWSCQPGSFVQCDRHNGEPRDVSFPNCESTALTDGQMRVVSVKSPDRRALSVEWRRLSEDGTQLLARRALDTGDVSIPASTDRRVLRLFRDGAAPVSFLLPAATTAVPLKLNDAEPGGELVHLDQSRIGRIAALALSGQSAPRIPVGAPPLTRWSLFSGIYSVRLAFSSGLLSETREIRLEDGKTTELLSGYFNPRSELVVEAEPEVMNFDPWALTVHRIDHDGGSATRKLIWKSETFSPALEWTIDGLEPGFYEVSIDGGQPIAKADAELGMHQSARVALTAPTAEISGRITMGDGPAPEGTRIHFEFNKARFQTTTGVDGTYRVRLAGPGKYIARIESAKYVWTWTDTVDVSAGLNRFDWTIPGGVLRVRILREDGKPIDENVQLQCAGRGFHAAGPVMTTEIGEPVVLTGLPFGEISCSADTNSGLVSDKLTVRLTSTSPSVDSSLRLRLLLGKIELISAQGTPLPGARVTVANITLDEEPAGSGVYALTRVAPGAGMLITAPGHLPLCRRLKPTDFPSTQIVMSAAGTVPSVIRLTPRATRAPGQVFGLLGSECPVPLHALEPKLRQVNGQSTDITFALPAGTYQYQPYSLFPLQTFSVPGAPLELTRPPK